MTQYLFLLGLLLFICIFSKLIFNIEYLKSLEILNRAENFEEIRVYLNSPAILNSVEDFEKTRVYLDSPAILSRAENFENIDESVCIDETSNKLRKTSKEEQKVLKSQEKVKTKKIKKEKEKEVFLIYGSFTYLEAKEICKLYNGSLATIQQLDEAFKKGANWCYWGWLEDESVAYPIQVDYWSKIEKIHKGYCGPTAGINRIKNINLLQKFSINCYGIKPKQTKKDKEKTNKLELDLSSYDSITNQIKKCKKEKQAKKQKELLSKLKKNVVILGFNKNKWSVFL